MCVLNTLHLFRFLKKNKNFYQNEVLFKYSNVRKFLEIIIEKVETSLSEINISSLDLTFDKLKLINLSSQMIIISEKFVRQFKNLKIITR